MDYMVEELKTIEMGFSDYIAIKQKEFDWLRQGKEEGRQEGYAHGLEEGLEQGREEGISVGLEQGAYQKALETARKLIVRGDSPEDVAQLLDLSLLEIQRLLNN